MCACCGGRVCVGGILGHLCLLIALPQKKDKVDRRWFKLGLRHPQELGSYPPRDCEVRGSVFLDNISKGWPPVFWERYPWVVKLVRSFLKDLHLKVKEMNLQLQVVSVQSLSHVQLFATPRTKACQASLSFTVSRRLLRLTSIELMMPSHRPITSSLK